MSTFAERGLLEVVGQRPVGGVARIRRVLGRVVRRAEQHVVEVPEVEPLGGPAWRLVAEVDEQHEHVQGLG